MEKLTVKNLGPLKNFTMETNALTVLIGPQASGKSLLMQLLYYFRNVKELSAYYYNDNISDSKWLEAVGSFNIFSLRSAVLGQLVRGDRAIIDYKVNNKIKYSISVTETSIILGEKLKKESIEWLKNMKSTADTLVEMMRHKTIFPQDIYIPAERSIYSLFNVKPMILFDTILPIQLRHFINNLETAKRIYGDMYKDISVNNIGGNNELLRLQWKALDGIVYCTKDNVLSFIRDDHVELLNFISSGQMATWPFFMLASVYESNTDERIFYYEEPETHLHPGAQVQVMNAVAYLLSKGHRLIISTHSPFILYVINNLMQAHIAYNGDTPEGKFSINPDQVSAYCLGDNPHSIVNRKTKLLELQEIDSVFDELNVDFEKYMDMEFAREQR